MQNTILYNEMIDDINHKSEMLRESFEFDSEIKYSHFTGLLKGVIVAGIGKLFYDVYTKKELFILNNKVSIVERELKKISNMGFRKEIGGLLNSLEFRTMECEKKLKEQTETSEKFVQIHMCIFQKFQFILMGVLDIYVNLLKSQGIMKVEIKNGFYDLITYNGQLNSNLITHISNIFNHYLDVISIIFKEDISQKNKVIEKIHSDIKERFNNTDIVVGTRQKTFQNRESVVEKRDFRPIVDRNQFNNRMNNNYERNKPNRPNNNNRPERPNREPFKRHQDR